jgi:hypothetical protein
MIRTSTELNDENFGWALSQAQQNPGSIVHFYNEPEMHGIDANDAANDWNNKFYPQFKAAGAKLVSPAVASNDAGAAWLATFFSAIGDNKPDFLGLHYYGTDASAAEKYLTDMHNAHPYPAIISEISSISRDQSQVNSFTADVANWLDQQDWVHQYGFFGVLPQVPDSWTSPAALLMNPDGSFNSLGNKLLHDQPIQV